MSTTPIHPPVVVITEERRRRKGLIWLAAGAAAAVALSGSTLALWAANDDFLGGRITAGDLNLTAGTEVFYDVSGDRTDGAAIPGTGSGLIGHEITPAQWRMVPGDKVAAVFPAEVTLDGDNLVAALSVAGLKEQAPAHSHLTWTYAVYQDDTELIRESALSGDATLMHLSATGNGQQGGADDHAPASAIALPGEEAATHVFPLDRDETGKLSSTLTVVVFAAFDVDAGDAAKGTLTANDVYENQTSDDGTRQGATSASDALTDIRLELSQVRDTGSQFGQAAPSGPNR